MGTVLNGDFEDGSTDWEVDSYGSGTPKLVEVSNEQPHSGSYSLKLSAGTGACVFAYGIIENVSISDTLSLYMYISEYDEGYIESFYICIIDAGEGVFYYEVDLTDYITTSGWQHITINMSEAGLDHEMALASIQLRVDRVVPS